MLEQHKYANSTCATSAQCKFQHTCIVSKLETLTQHTYMCKTSTLFFPVQVVGVIQEDCGINYSYFCTVYCRIMHALIPESSYYSENYAGIIASSLVAGCTVSRPAQQALAHYAQNLSYYAMLLCSKNHTIMLPSPGHYAHIMLI